MIVAVIALCLCAILGLVLLLWFILYMLKIRCREVTSNRFMPHVEQFGVILIGGPLLFVIVNSMLQLPYVDQIQWSTIIFASGLLLTFLGSISLSSKVMRPPTTRLLKAIVYGASLFIRDVGILLFVIGLYSWVLFTALKR